MWFFGLIVVLLVGAVAVVASGRWGAMSTAYDDRPDVSVPARQALTSDDIETARFGVGLRGYRMDEVDNLLERIAREVAERDRRIADLERAVTPIVHGPEGAGFTARVQYDPADFDDTGYQKPIMVGGDFPEPTLDPTPVAEPLQPVAESVSVAESMPVAEPLAAAEHAPVSPPAPAPEPLSSAEDEPEPWFEPGPLAEPAQEGPPAAGESEEVVQEPSQAEPEQEGHSVLDDQPQPPAQVPLPPLLQELMKTKDAADEPAAEPWFRAKEPPPDLIPEPSDEPADGQEPGIDGEEAGVNGEEAARGRHSAAPDVNVQRPTR